jgi:hypothetical protein
VKVLCAGGKNILNGLIAWLIIGQKVQREETKIIFPQRVGAIKYNFTGHMAK